MTRRCVAQPLMRLVACALATAVGALLPVGSHAQPDSGSAIRAQPAASILEGLAPLSEVAVLEGPPTAVALLQSTVGALEPMRFAEPYEVEVNPTSHGLWETSVDGEMAVWRLRIRSTGAVSLNMGFTRYRMPPGGRLLIHRPDGREALGPFTDADNEAHGELWTPLISGGEAVVEVVLPVSRIAELELELAAVNRGFRELAPDRVVSSVHASCHIDVACREGDPYRDQIRSVASLVIRGTLLCSGVLLDNTARDDTPYMLTAQHCGFDLGPEAAARGTVVYWNHQTPVCGERYRETSPPWQSGARYVAGNAATDFVLIELDDPLDWRLRPFFAGWDRGEAAPSSAVGIHQPQGHLKSITIEDGPLSVTSYLLHVSPGDGTFLRMLGVDRGGFEGGSSGSAAFDQNKRVVGQLKGGTAYCGHSNHNAWYGRLARSWTGGGTATTRLSDWLDPAGTGETAIDGRNFNIGPVASGTLDDKGLRLADGTVAGALSVDVAGRFRDREGDRLTFSASSSDESVVAVAVERSTVTVAPVAAGTATITVTATDVDGANENASSSFEVTVGDNRSPEAEQWLAFVELKVADGNRSLDLSAAFVEADGDELTYVASSSNESVATVEVAGGGAGSQTGAALILRPVAAGVATVAVAATDVAGSNTSARLRFKVEVLSLAPVAVGALPPLMVLPELSPIHVDLADAFEDPEGDPLTFSVSSSNWKVVQPRVSGSSVRLNVQRAGTAKVTVMASDGSRLRARQSFEVTSANGPPRGSSFPAWKTVVLEVGAGSGTWDLASHFRDPEGDRLTYAATTAAPVAKVAVSGPTLTLTPRSEGSTSIFVSARDAEGSNSLAVQEIFVFVQAKPELVVSPGALTLVEGATGSYTVRLGRSPSGPVIVTPSEVGSNKLLVSPPSVALTPTTWRGRTVTVEASQDGDQVADAPILIRHAVSGIGSGAVSPPSVSVTVVEDDAPTLSVAAASVAESGGSLTFDVMLSASSSSDVEVDYATSDVSGAGGAQAGSDYTATSGTLTFPAGSTSAREVRVPVTNDSEDEAEEERLSFTLGNARNAPLAGGGSTLVVAGAIEDDDRPEVDISFQSSAHDLPEGGTVTVVVLLSRDPEGYFEVPLVRDHRSGASWVDYSGVPWRLAFRSGVTRQEFLVAARTDPFDDEGEVVTLSFGSLPPWANGGGPTAISILNTVGSGGGSPGGGGGSGGGGSPGGGGGGGGGSPGGPPSGDDGDDDGGGSGGGGGAVSPPRAAVTTNAECAEELCRARTGVAVLFEDASTGTVSSRRWEFGDGDQSRSRETRHAWSEPGFYVVTLWTSNGSDESTATLTFLVEAADPAGTCVPSAETLCLQDSRYAVSVDWWLHGTGYDDHDHAKVVRTGTNDSGLFRFFDPDNWEILIKVLDGCAVNGHVWVFGASTTDLGYVIQVTDTVTGAVKEYRNEPGLPAAAIADGKAFRACAR